MKKSLILIKSIKNHKILSALVKYWPNISIETIFMNTENSKRNKPHKLVLKLPQRLYLRNSNKHVAQTCLFITLEKNKTTVQKQWTQNNSSNLEWWVWITWGFLFSVRYSTLYIIKKKEKLTTSRSSYLHQ